MQVTHGNYLKGLSIAVIVLAGLCILGFLIGIFMLGIVGSAVSAIDPYYLDAYDYYDYYYDYDYETAEAFAIASMVGGVFCVLGMLCAAVTLVAGIIGLRGANDPSKLGMVFGWSVAGAVVSLLSCGIVSTVLLVIMAVFAYKDKNYYLMGGQQPAYAPVSQAGVPAASAAPIPQPAAQPVPAPTAQPQAPAPQPSADAAVQPVAGAITIPAQPGVEAIAQPGPSSDQTSAASVPPAGGQQPPSA